MPSIESILLFQHVLLTEHILLNEQYFSRNLTRKLLDFNLSWVIYLGNETNYIKSNKVCYVISVSLRKTLPRRRW